MKIARVRSDMPGLVRGSSEGICPHVSRNVLRKQVSGVSSAQYKLPQFFGAFAFVSECVFVRSERGVGVSTFNHLIEGRGQWELAECESQFARSPVWFHISVGISYIKGYTPSPSLVVRTRSGPDLLIVDCVIVRSCELFNPITNVCCRVSVIVGELSDCFGLFPYVNRKHRSWVCAVRSGCGGSPQRRPEGRPGRPGVAPVKSGEGRLLFVTRFRGEIGFAIFP